MMQTQFSRLPTWWIHNSKTNDNVQSEASFLQEYFTAKGSELGENIAALKCYLALISNITFSSGKSELTYSKIEEIAGLSRPMVAKGIQRLQETSLIKIDREGRINSYQIKLDFDDFDRWAKAPRDALIKNLSDIPSRGIYALTALKIYLLLLAIRNGNAVEISASYDFLERNCSIQRQNIRKALSLLSNCGFIDIAKTAGKDSIYLHNEFKLRGITI